MALPAVEAGNVPRCTTAHLLLGHVDCLAAPWTDVGAPPARLLLGHWLHRAVLRGHVCLGSRWDVAGGRPVLVLVPGVHGEHPCAAPVAVALGAKQLAVAGAAVDVPLVLRQVAAVQPPVAVRIATGEALDVPVLPDGDFLLVEEHGRVAPGADSRHGALVSAPRRRLLCRAALLPS